MGIFDKLSKKKVTREGEKTCKYVNKELGFELDYPEGWMERFEGGDLMFTPYNPKVVVDGNEFISVPAITVLVAQRPSPITITRKEFVKGYISDLPYEFISEGTFVTKSGEEGDIFNYLFTRGGHQLRGVFGMVLYKDRKIYMVDGYAFPSEYDKYASEFEKTISSLYLLKK